MKNLDKSFFNKVVALLTDSQRLGIEVYGTLRDTTLPPNDIHWFNSTVVAPTVSLESLGALLASVESVEFADDSGAAINSISITKERGGIRLTARVVRFQPLKGAGIQGTNDRDYTNEWVAK